jgi:hypothetical protein
MSSTKGLFCIRVETPSGVKRLYFKVHHTSFLSIDQLFSFVPSSSLQDNQATWEDLLAKVLSVPSTTHFFLFSSPYPLVVIAEREWC